MHGREIEWHLQKHVAWMPMLSLPSWFPAVVAAAVIGWERCGKPAVHLLATTIPRSDCSLYWTLNFHADYCCCTRPWSYHNAVLPLLSFLLPPRTPAKSHLKDFSALPTPPPLTMFAARTAASRFVARSIVSYASRGLMAPSAVATTQQSMRCFATVSLF